jgi:hypothetical protein
LFPSFVIDFVCDIIDSDFLLAFLHGFDESRSRSSDSSSGSCARSDTIDEYSATASCCGTLKNCESTSSCHIADTSLCCGGG